MSFFDRIRGHKSNSIPPNATFRLTQEGRAKLQSFDGDARSRILMALETSDGSSNIDEISAAAKVGRGQVEKMIPKLVSSGYVQLAGGGGRLSSDEGMEE